MSVYPAGLPPVPPGFGVSPRPAAPYCTDEAIAIRAPGDFVAICPPDQRMAAGKAGTIPAGGWALSDPGLDLSGAGITPGMLVHWAKSTPQGRAPELLAVDSFAGRAAVLRRKGLAAGQGDPPGGPAGLSAIEYAVPTLLPQIRKACYDINRRYGVDDFFLGRRQSDLFDPREVEDVAVLTVLANQYGAMARQTKDDSFALKAKSAAAELQDLLRRVEVLWRPTPAAPGPAGASA